MGNVDDAPKQRIQTALELIALGEEMLRQRLRRQSPSLPDEEIDAQVGAWYERRPGAEHGDAPGRPRRSLAP